MPASEPVVTTVLLQFVGLALAGLAALVGWLFGWLPDPGLFATVAVMISFGPAVEVFRAGRPPRGLAVAAASLTLGAVAVLVAVAMNWALPSAADQGIGLAVGFLVGMPAGVAVLARLLGTGDVG
ncbi:hypothetical protein K1J60_32495 [Streptomyces akebiae]|uniref:Integral membrane protein n=1 Tax=Streptomyces akebiae TaxID=2865673 RepID=A0ABX8Y575_9ACTN|nr:hypothetical protein K1J60_32495 [Streptomyces akebiae]